MLRSTRVPAFEEPAHEWRRIFAETWGTFLLVLVAAGAAVGATKSTGITLGMQVAAPGLMVMAIIYFMGAVSGAHLNPAVTLAFAVRRNFPWNRVPGYLGAQCIGAIAAVAFLRLMFGDVGRLGATLPGVGVGNIKATIVEIVLTAGLVSTILGTASGRAQHRCQRCARRRRIHRAGRLLGGVALRRINESRPFVRARSSSRRSEYNRCVCCGTYHRRADRRRVRVDSQRSAHCRRLLCRSG